MFVPLFCGPDVPGQRELGTGLGREKENASESSYRFPFVWAKSLKPNSAPTQCMALFLALNNTKLRSCFLWDPLTLSSWRTVSPSKGQHHYKQCCLLKLEATLTSGYDWKEARHWSLQVPEKNRLEAITDVRPDTWSSNSTASLRMSLSLCRWPPTAVEKWWISQSAWTPTSEDICPAVSSSSLTCSSSSSPGRCAQVTCLICIPDSQDLSEHISFCPPLLQVIPGLRSCSLFLGCLRG